MKVPTKCPFCGDTLLNTFPPAEDFNNQVTKYCNRRVIHKVTIIVENDEVVTFSMSLEYNTKLQITWGFKSGKLWVWDDKPFSPITYLPFFDPDFSDYRKLVNKIKTYLVFS